MPQVPDRDSFSIRQRAMLLAVVCTMLPLWGFGLLLLFAGGQQHYRSQVAEGIRTATSGQLNLAVKTHSSRISHRMDNVGYGVLQLRNYAQEVLGRPEFYGGAATPPAPDANLTPPASPLPKYAPLDNPLYYSLGPEGAIRRLIDDGHPSVFFARRNFDRYDYQRLFATAALDPLLTAPVTIDPLCSRTFVMTSDNLVRTYPFFNFTHWEPNADLAKPRDYWMADKADARGLVWTSPYISLFSGQWVVACLGGIEIGGRVLGVAGAEIQVSALESELLGFSLGPGGMAWLARPSAGEQGPLWTVISTQDGVNELLRLVPLAEAALPDEKQPTAEILAEAELFGHAPEDLARSLAELEQSGNGTASIGPPEEARHVAVSKIASTGWLLCGQIVLPAQQAAYQFQQGLDQRQRWEMTLFIFVLFCAVLLAVVVAIFAAGQLARPLEVLTLAVERARRGESSGIVAFSGFREINALATALRELLAEREQRRPALPAEVDDYDIGNGDEDAEPQPEHGGGADETDSDGSSEADGDDPGATDDPHY